MPPSPINNRKDLLLLLLYSPGKTGALNEPIVGRTRLVKMLYLFRREVLPEFKKGTEITEENFYQFFPWDFGPFSTQVYDDITFFVLRGFIEPTPSDEEPLPESAAEWDRWLQRSDAEETPDIDDDFVEDEFKLTDQGVAFARKLYDALTARQREILRLFKTRTAGAPLRGILRYVYEQYPEETTKSKIRDEVLGKPF